VPGTLGSQAPLVLGQEIASIIDVVGGGARHPSVLGLEIAGISRGGVGFQLVKNKG
jgi:hypothetical protein